MPVNSCIQYFLVHCCIIFCSVIYMLCIFLISSCGFIDQDNVHRSCFLSTTSLWRIIDDYIHNLMMWLWYAQNSSPTEWGRGPRGVALPGYSSSCEVRGSTPGVEVRGNLVLAAQRKGESQSLLAKAGTASPGAIGECPGGTICEGSFHRVWAAEQLDFTSPRPSMCG